MAVQLVDARGKKRKLTSEYLLELLGDGNKSKIEDLEDDETHEEEGIEAVPDRVAAGQSYSDDESSNSEPEEATNIQVPERITPSLNAVCTESQRSREVSRRARRVLERSRGVSQRGRSVSRGHQLPGRSSSALNTSRGTSRHRTRHRTSRNDQLPESSSTPPRNDRVQSEVAQRDRDPSRRRLWKCIPFDQKEHNFPSREQQTIRTPQEYFEDYFDDAFYEKAKNSYHLRKTGRLLHTSARLYKIHCETARVHRGQVFDLLQFKMQVADCLTNTPDRPRLDQDPDENMEGIETQGPENVDPNIPSARLYKIHCETARVHRGQVFDLLQFKMQVADCLTNTPDRPRLDQDPDENMEGIETQGPRNVDPNIPAKRYRPANVPSEAKRHDGYEHYPVFDEIENPRFGCSSRSNIRCKKCNLYLCLNRKGNYFTSFHKQQIEAKFSKIL